ncbi:MAG: ABC transporter permease subunit [Chloroflexi bacterium]|jgi:ABC-2 type transport system permease protein|nr:ABC transporter permease subunit [Chloroflexota bacterium]
MSNISQAIWVEMLKARRSKMPLLTVLAFSLAPLAGGFFMFIMKDPELARRLGVISLKAQIVAGSADWLTFLDILTQAVAIGGIILFSLITSWVFGREYADYTISDLLALPTSRSAVVLAKFFLIVLWSAALTVVITLIGLGVGTAVVLPAAPSEVFWQGTITLAITACLTIALVTPIAFVASAGRGYLPPMGAAIMAVILAQVIAATGWGEYFPWSIPALFSGMAGPAYATLGLVSYLIVLLMSLAGLVATFAWWELADQAR